MAKGLQQFAGQCQIVEMEARGHTSTLRLRGTSCFEKAARGFFNSGWSRGRWIADWTILVEIQGSRFPGSGKRNWTLRVDGAGPWAAITPVSFTNEYNWGNFKGDPYKLMQRHFDAHVYVANWMTAIFMVRLPIEALTAPNPRPCHLQVPRPEQCWMVGAGPGGRRVGQAGLRRTGPRRCSPTWKTRPPGATWTCSNPNPRSW
jgi:hypothetical protein